MSDSTSEIEKAIKKATEEVDLTRSETRATFDQIMAGDASPAQISSLITALRMKGETIEEVQGGAASMRDAAVTVDHDGNQPLLDIVGTGGDEKNTFNISTTSSFVAAGAGCIVAKHGNRSVSSSSGSADVLETLGIHIETTPEENEEILNRVGLSFLYAPVHHPAMKHAIGPRKEIGIRTIFNILGPITNPAGADRYLLGAFDESLAEKLAHALTGLDTEHALVVHGSGYDEVALTGPTTIFEVQDEDVESKTIVPEQFDYDRCSPEELQVDGPEESADTIRSILDGSNTGPPRSIIELNAGLAIYAAGRADAMEDGIDQARETIRSGAAEDKLQQLIETSQSFI